MRRQLVASGAAITIAAAVAFALPAIAQSEPEPFEGNVTCEELEADGFIEGLIEEGGIKVDPAVDEINEFFAADVHDGGTLLDVVANEGFVILAVIVKGGEDSNVYFEEPFVDMHAPVVGQPGNIPEISHYEVCIGEEEEETTPPTTPPTMPPTTETPSVQPTTPVETPAPVPTEVPAGDTEGNSGSAGLFGLVLAASVAVAGAAMAARRRFLHDS
jgi:hypothetical protein